MVKNCRISIHSGHPCRIALKSQNLQIISKCFMKVWSLKYKSCRKMEDHDATSASPCLTCFRSPSLMVPCLKQRGDVSIETQLYFLSFWKHLGIGKLSANWRFFPESQSKGYHTISYHRISTTKGVNRAGKDDNQGLGWDLSRAMKCCRTCTKEKGHKILSFC